MGLFDMFKKKNDEKKSVVICSPLSGELASIDQTPDEAFASKMMGDGVVIIPSDGEVVAPFDGKVEMVFPTKHAIGLSSNDGVQILIHFGIDTNSLDGEGFEVFVEQGQEVKKGQKLLNADIDFIKSKGISTHVPVVFTELAEDKTINILKTGNVSKEEEIVEIK